MNRERQRAASHERILSAAARLLRERGLQDATVGSVMARAGLTVGGFYSHFHSKRALMASAFSRASEHTRTALLAGLENAAPETWLRTIVRRYVTPEHRDANPPLCALPVTISEAARAGRSDRQVYADAFGRFVTALEQRAGICPKAAARRASARSGSSSPASAAWRWRGRPVAHPSPTRSWRPRAASASA